MNPGNGSDKVSLEHTVKYNPPMDHVAAARNLKEAKQILDGLGVVFLLGSGTCLGAIRDKAFIAWDDDIDLVAVVGVNGLIDETLDFAAAAFRDKGFFVATLHGKLSKFRVTMKDYIRLSLEWLRIVDDNIYAYPGVKLPARLFTQPKEIDFLGEKFFVPNPPTEMDNLGAALLANAQALVNEFSKLLVTVTRSIEDDGQIEPSEAKKIRQSWEMLKNTAETFTVGCERGLFYREGESSR